MWGRGGGGLLQLLVGVVQLPQPPLLLLHLLLQLSAVGPFILQRPVQLIHRAQQLADLLMQRLGLCC